MSDIVCILWNSFTGSCRKIKEIPGPKVIQQFFLHNAAEHEIFLAHKC